MNILILLLGTSVVVALVFLGAFLWANRTGQFDDTLTPAHRILLDTDPTLQPDTNQAQPEH